MRGRATARWIEQARRPERRNARLFGAFSAWHGLAARVERPELMDLPGQDPAALAENLADIRRVNRWLGGRWLTVRAVGRLAAMTPPGSPLLILDVATGTADIPLAVVAWARRQGRVARVVATDISADILRLTPGDRPAEVTLAVADGRRLPFDDDAFDIAMCSLALHHLPPEAATMMLREMGRVARRGVVVNDLVRGRAGYAGAWLFSRLLTRNPLTRHDAPLSVQRAYTRAEMAALADRAGLGAVRFVGLPGYRVAMTAGGER